MRIYLLVTVMLIMCSSSLHGQSDDFKTQTLFIYNFIKYSSWPSSSDQFIIQVYGNSPIVGELKKLAAVKRAVSGEPIVIVQCENLNEIRDCKILYVSNEKSKEMEKITQITKDKSFLIISPKEGLTKKGAAICFFVKDDDRLGFEVSRSKLNERKIKLSGELMRMAEFVD
jgi:YfiR/HmsC-like